MVVTAQRLAGSLGLPALGAVVYAALHPAAGPDRHATAMEGTAVVAVDGPPERI